MDKLEKEYFNLLEEYRNLRELVNEKEKRIEELKQDLENQANHYQAIIQSKSELIDELRERARN